MVQKGNFYLGKKGGEHCHWKLEWIISRCLRCCETASMIPECGSA